MLGVPDSFAIRENLGLTKFKLWTLSYGLGDDRRFYPTGS